MQYRKIKMEMWENNNLQREFYGTGKYTPCASCTNVKASGVVLQEGKVIEDSLNDHLSPLWLGYANSLQVNLQHIGHKYN